MKEFIFLSLWDCLLVINCAIIVEYFWPRNSPLPFVLCLVFFLYWCSVCWSMMWKLLDKENYKKRLFHYQAQAKLVNWFQFQVVTWSIILTTDLKLVYMSVCSSLKLFCLRKMIAKGINFKMFLENMISSSSMICHVIRHKATFKMI